MTKLTGWFRKLLPLTVSLATTIAAAGAIAPPTSASGGGGRTRGENCSIDC